MQTIVYLACCFVYDFMKHLCDGWSCPMNTDKPCELRCVSRDDNDIEMLGGFVADGTPCRQNLGSRDMCIAGVCYKVGCDWIVDSDVEEDECGVCGGNGTDCKTVQGIYSKGTTRQSGFSEVIFLYVHFKKNLFCQVYVIYPHLVIIPGMVKLINEHFVFPMIWMFGLSFSYSLYIINTNLTSILWEYTFV